MREQNRSRSEAGRWHEFTALQKRSAVPTAGFIFYLLGFETQALWFLNNKSALPVLVRL